MVCRLWKHVRQPTQRPGSSRRWEGRLGRGTGRRSEVPVVGGESGRSLRKVEALI